MRFSFGNSFRFMSMDSFRSMSVTPVYFALERETMDETTNSKRRISLWQHVADAYWL
jgi:hypothetical protein